ncbi:hypothetical protein H9P43_007358 [Blastocladiella emersonii ATCC 22665]|nr:hypothetical protein H9P43_007358 [Blastocladiella emersonii ATCC 22665]
MEPEMEWWRMPMRMIESEEAHQTPAEVTKGWKLDPVDKGRLNRLKRGQPVDLSPPVAFIPPPCWEDLSIAAAELDADLPSPSKILGANSDPASADDLNDLFDSNNLFDSDDLLDPVFHASSLLPKHMFGTTDVDDDNDFLTSCLQTSDASDTANKDDNDNFLASCSQTLRIDNGHGPNHRARHASVLTASVTADHDAPLASATGVPKPKDVIGVTANGAALMSPIALGNVPTLGGSSSDSPNASLAPAPASPAPAPAAPSPAAMAAAAKRARCVLSDSAIRVKTKVVVPNTHVKLLPPSSGKRLHPDDADNDNEEEEDKLSPLHAAKRAKPNHPDPAAQSQSQSQSALDLITAALAKQTKLAALLAAKHEERETQAAARHANHEARMLDMFTRMHATHAERDELLQLRTRELELREREVRVRERELDMREREFEAQNKMTKAEML